jgi:protein-L-isoaspartate(D-aspartate) O-methyltransferase
MLDAADLEPGDVVLELGCGLGYCTALLAHIADAVVAVEQDESLAAEAESTCPITGSTMPPW